ncbi:hypothetical protein ACEWY4_017253 [Coilia grayii]|uniref:Ig-like domain-containing protein n=1 Tax=Coilia grayii TaxID=363190 RepID=A0ABD1JGB4_9TELE
MGETGSYVFLALLLILNTIKVSDACPSSYIRYKICALSGSEEYMYCSIDRPEIGKHFWVTQLEYNDNRPRNVTDLPDYNVRGRDYGCSPFNKCCALKLSGLKTRDSGEYHMMIGTSDPNKKPQRKCKITLSVKELSVGIPEPVIEGNNVTLSCNNICSSMDKSKVMWKKNNQTVPAELTTNGSLVITKVSTNDEGSYTCSIDDATINVPSKPVQLHVMFPPRIPSVSVRPSADIPEGSSVTLTCSSDVNPPVESYTWYRRTGSAVSKLDSKQSYSISSISDEHTDYYYCEAKNRYGGRNSTEVHLDVQYSPRNMFASINQSGEVVEGSSVTLTCISDANPPVETYTWYKRTGAATVQVDTGVSITFTLTSITAGLYHCKAQNRVGCLNSTGVDVALPVLQTNSPGWLNAALLASLGAVIFVIVVAGLVYSRRKKRHKSTNKNIHKQYQNDPQSENQDTFRMSSEPDAVYQSLNPNTTQTEAVY